MTIEDDERLAGRAMQAKNYSEAVRLLRLLAERNSEYALLTLGWIYETGAAGVSDNDAARTWYGRAAAEGSLRAHLGLGRVFLKQGKESQARAAFEHGARSGDEECKSALAKLNDERDEKLALQAIKAGAYEEAINLLRPLAERQSGYALLALGWIHETGATGARDKNAARAYYERAAAAGSARAWHDLGRLFSAEGEQSQARAAFAAGAERGNIPCMSRLGRMMVEGKGGPADIGTGSGWLEKAAAKGHVFAKRTLLAIEESNARSLFAWFSVKWRITLLSIRGARQMVKKPDSELVRY